MNNNCNLTTCDTAKMTNWKPVDQVREYGNQTDFVETSEFPDEPIKHFVDNEKECAEASRKALCDDENRV